MTSPAWPSCIPTVERKYGSVVGPAATIYFTSREYYQAYREERLPGLQREIEGTSWAKELAFEHVFELEDI